MQNLNTRYIKKFHSIWLSVTQLDGKISCTLTSLEYLETIDISDIKGSYVVSACNILKKKGFNILGYSNVDGKTYIITDTFKRIK